MNVSSPPAARTSHAAISTDAGLNAGSDLSLLDNFSQRSGSGADLVQAWFRLNDPSTISALYEWHTSALVLVHQSGHGTIVSAALLAASRQGEGVALFKAPGRLLESDHVGWLVLDGHRWHPVSLGVERGFGHRCSFGSGTYLARAVSEPNLPQQFWAKYGYPFGVTGYEPAITPL